MAARLNKLAATLLAAPDGQQALTDYTNVYVPPDVDDLDNYLQVILPLSVVLRYSQVSRVGRC